jgi:hypothetical protein
MKRSHGFDCAFLTGEYPTSVFGSSNVCFRTGEVIRQYSYGLDDVYNVFFKHAFVVAASSGYNWIRLLKILKNLSTPLSAGVTYPLLGKSVVLLTFLTDLAHGEYPPGFPYVYDTNGICDDREAVRHMHIQIRRHACYPVWVT